MPRTPKNSRSGRRSTSTRKEQGKKRSNSLSTKDAAAVQESKGRSGKKKAKTSRSKLMSPNSKQHIMNVKMARFQARKGVTTKADIGKRKKGKKNNDGKPKRARSAYILFCKEERKRFLENNKDITQKDVMAGLAKLWKEASDDVRDEFAVMAEEDKVRYEKQLEEWQVFQPPKKPRVAYNYFVAITRPQIKEKNPEASFKDISKLIGESWKALTEKGKVRFVKMETADKKRYEKEVADWKEACENREEEEDKDEDEE